MNIRFLETAIALAQLRNFRMTADKLNITTAAVSNRITAMEDELGFRLFERDSRDVSVTELGQRFIDGARAMVADYHALVASLSPQNGFSGTVRMGLLPAMAQTLLPGLANVLQNEFSGVQFSVTTDATPTLIERLDARELDIVIGIPRGESPDLVVNDLCSFGMFWIAAPRLLRHAASESLTLGDLATYPIISYERGAHNERRIAQYFAANAIEPRVVHHSNSLATMVGMVEAGLGISALPAVCIQRQLREGSLAVLNVHTPFSATDYAVFYNRSERDRLPRLITQLARKVAKEFCADYVDAVAVFTG